MDIRELTSKRNFAFYKIDEINKQMATLQRELDFFVATTIAVDKEVEDLKRQFNVERVAMEGRIEKEVKRRSHFVSVGPNNGEDHTIRTTGYFDNKGNMHVTSVESYGGMTAEEIKKYYGIDVDTKK